MSKSVPHNAIHEHKEAGKGRNFKNHTQSGRGETKGLKNHPSFGRGKTGSSSNHAAYVDRGREVSQKPCFMWAGPGREFQHGHLICAQVGRATRGVPAHVP